MKEENELRDLSIKLNDEQKKLQSVVTQLADLKKHFNITEGFDKFAIVIFHPLPEEMNNAGEIFENILIVLEELKLNSFVSYPNVDPGNHEIIDIIVIDMFVFIF